MVKHNNVVPNVHFKKWWQRYVRTWLDQPMKKKTRVMKRQEKAKKIWPRPVGGLLRPAVHPPTQRYNLKIRQGRGFTLEELKSSGISAKFARTVGIAVDHRRRNKSAESLVENTQRLKEYKAKLMVFPRKSKAKKGDTAKSELATATVPSCKSVLPMPKLDKSVPSTTITAKMKEGSRFIDIRLARAKAWNEGTRLKKIKAAENAEK